MRIFVDFAYNPKLIPVNFSGTTLATFIPEDMRRRLSVWVWLLGVIAAPVTGFSQSFSLGLSGDEAIPEFVVDTADYQISFMLVNTHTQPFSGPVDIMMSVEGDEPSLLSGFNVSTPILPGDSLKLPALSHHFNEARFTGGGGLTYDIIVWPMSIGVGLSDSMSHTLTYQHTQPNANRLAVTCPPKGLPGEVIEGQTYDLVLTVINRDTTHKWYQPFSLGMGGEGINTNEILTNQKLKAPVDPGDSITIVIPGHSFDIATGGGGLTYDIIVWPMSIGTSDADSLYHVLRIFDGAAIEVIEQPSAPLPDPVNAGSGYQVDLTLDNHGGSQTNGPVDLLIQVDDLDPVVIKTLSDPIPGQGILSVTIDNLNVLEAYEGLEDGIYDLHIYAQERNTETWLNRLYKELAVETIAATSMTLVPEQGAVTIEWTNPWDLASYEYQVRRQNLVTPQERPVLISTIPGIHSPEIPVSYTTSDLSPISDPVSYSIIRRDLRTNVHEVISSKEIQIRPADRNAGQMMVGSVDSPERRISIELDEASDAVITWYDVTGRELGRETAWLPSGLQTWVVQLPDEVTGIVYWTISSGTIKESGRTVRH